MKSTEILAVINEISLLGFYIILLLPSISPLMLSVQRISFISMNLILFVIVFNGAFNLLISVINFKSWIKSRKNKVTPFTPISDKENNFMTTV